MRLALSEAQRAWDHEDVPVGAVLVSAGDVIASGRNRRELDGDPTAHAEVVAMRAAAQALGHWRLADTTLYVTLEPCAMCAGALVNARVSRLVFGAWDPKAGASGSLMNICQDARLNHRLEVDAGILEEDCGALLRAFFRERRQRKRQQKRSTTLDSESDSPPGSSSLSPP